MELFCSQCKCVLTLVFEGSGRLFAVIFANVTSEAQWASAVALTTSHKSHFLQIMLFVSLILQSDETETRAFPEPMPAFLELGSQSKAHAQISPPAVGMMTSI